jgi:short-subunit dehydrogenase
MRLVGAVALITGASSGIGAAAAAALARAGARLILTGRDEDRLASVAARTGGLALPADLAEADGPDQLIKSALGEAGRIDVLVCNAGTGWAGPIGDLPGSKATELIAVNLLAPVQLARLVAPGMAERGAGRLIFVSSIAGMTGVRNEAVYAATKAGVNYLAESLGYELAGTGAGVSLVLPGVVAAAGGPTTAGCPLRSSPSVWRAPSSRPRSATWTSSSFLAGCASRPGCMARRRAPSAG